MKKLSLLLVAFALVMGLSQCRKPKLPVFSGGTQHVVLNASWDNGGSKIDQEGIGLKWEKDDKLTVSGGATGELTCTDEENGTFEGIITKTTGEKIIFTFKSTGYKEDLKNQTGALNDAVRLSGESEYKADGNYDVPMTMPHAVLKLDLSGFAATTKTGETMVKILINGLVKASVANITSDSKAVYVAIPADENPSEKLYTFSGNGMFASVPCPLKTNTFYTKKGEGETPTGESIVIKPAAPKFSVSAETKVEFAPGNLYYDGTDNKWKFESNQWGFANTWSVNHVSHFFWSKYADEAIKELFNSEQDMSTGDVFFTNLSETTANPDFQVDGESVGTWRSLSRDEWCYLLGFDPESATKTETYGRPDAKTKCTWKSLDNGIYNGFVILPDDTENPSMVMSSIESTSDIATYGAVFLPAAGYREGTDMNDVGSDSFYWSSTPDNWYGNAYLLYFGSDGVDAPAKNRDVGCAVRLVR